MFSACTKMPISNSGQAGAAGGLDWEVFMAKKNSFMFTNKEHTQKGIMATILGVISLATLVYMMVMSYQRAGDIPRQYGAAALLSMLFAFVGIVLGVISKSERDKFYFFSYLGIGLNVLVLAVLSAILYAGAYA